jgi:hypothetical protein
MVRCDWSSDVCSSDLELSDPTDLAFLLSSLFFYIDAHSFAKAKEIATGL